MRLGLLAIVAAALVVAGGSVERAAPASSSAATDVRFLMNEIKRIHPDPFHATPEPQFQAAADSLAARADSLSPDELLVDLMRFVNLLGEREGHSGIFTLDAANKRVLHLFPLYLYKFSDGLFVVSAPGRRGLVGSKLLAIDGIPADQLERQVRPLVPRDNEATRTDRFMSFMLTAEVLHGLGLRAGTGPARFSLQRPGSAVQEVTLAPVTASAYVRLMTPEFPSFVYALPKRPQPLYLRRRGEDHYVTTVDRGRVVFVGYNMTLGLDRSRRAEARAAREEPEGAAGRGRRAAESRRRQPHLCTAAGGAALEGRQPAGTARGADLAEHVLGRRQLHHRARPQDEGRLRRRDLRRRAEPLRRCRRGRLAVGRRER